MIYNGLSISFEPLNGLRTVDVDGGDTIGSPFKLSD